ncbi:hypothetical protein F4777DRAFT_254625 [Nemania sp. FL0916]|nr:hypothetical protein F4777DRAFT_254625 [Nemania sp. FL0916]
MPTFLERTSDTVGDAAKIVSIGKRGVITPSPNRTGELDLIKILVGPNLREFLIPRSQLASCEYFRARLELTYGQADHVIRLEGQCPDMFRLFEYWLSERKGFGHFINDAEMNEWCEDLHWDLVNLQLFAANIGEAALQDVAMDALQDLYLRCNWEIDPELVKYVYAECDIEASYCLRSLRRWIVAMIAWGMGDVEAGGALETIFGECAGLKEEYDYHLKKVAASKLDVDFKNPQLRLPSNKLKSEERQFGYRQCSFHTHRSAVGQGRCPHAHPLTPLMYYSARTDGSTESDSERSESKYGSRLASPNEIELGIRKATI